MLFLSCFSLWYSRILENKGKIESSRELRMFCTYVESLLSITGPHTKTIHKSKTMHAKLNSVEAKEVKSLNENTTLKSGSPIGSRSKSGLYRKHDQTSLLSVKITFQSHQRVYLKAKILWKVVFVLPCKKHRWGTEMLLHLFLLVDLNLSTNFVSKNRPRITKWYIMVVAVVLVLGAVVLSAVFVRTENEGRQILRALWLRSTSRRVTDILTYRPLSRS